MRFSQMQVVEARRIDAVAIRGPYAKGVAKREEILQTALEIIARDGYSGATVKQIADAVGLSQNGLLHYFGSKDALFTEVLRQRDRADEQRQPIASTSAEIIDRLTAFHRLVGQASGNPDFPIYITETGWTTASNKCGVSEQAQADNTAQLILWASTATRWLKGMWLYELKDSGKNPSELEDNFGLYRFDNSPKPVACAAQGAWAFVRSSLSAERRELASGVVSINASTASGGRVAVWSEAPDRRYEIRLKGDQPSASFAMPCDQTARPASGVWIPVSSTPVLIAANDSAVPALEIRPAR